jgi:YgiT-type zinc finger domain-containing protein
MKCFLCKGKLENSDSTFMLDLGSCIVIIKKVPSLVCAQCGEVSYSNAVAQQLEQIVKSIRDGANNELTIVNYAAKAA